MVVLMLIKGNQLGRLQKMRAMQLLLPVTVLSVLALTSSGCTTSSSQAPVNPALETFNQLEGFLEKEKTK